MLWLVVDGSYQRVGQEIAKVEDGSGVRVTVNGDRQKWRKELALGSGHMDVWPRFGANTDE